MSPVLFEQYKEIANFKANFHHVHICAKKDVEEVWYELPFFVTDDDIMQVVSNWPSDWLTPPTEEAETGQAGISGVRTEKKPTKKGNKKVNKKVIIELEKGTALETKREVEHEEQATEGDDQGGEDPFVDT